VADFYRAVAGFLKTAFERVEGAETEEATRARLLAVEARDRAGEALGELMNERAVNLVDPWRAAFLLASGARAMVAGDGLNLLADTGYQGRQCPQAVQELRAQTESAVTALRRLADELDGRKAEGTPSTPSRDGRRQAALHCLRRWRKDPGAGHAAIAVVAAEEWIDQLSALEADLQEPVREAAAASRVPWWR
jgi:hypothetical protein